MNHWKNPLYHSHLEPDINLTYAHSSMYNKKASEGTDNTMLKTSFLAAFSSRILSIVS